MSTRGLLQVCGDCHSLSFEFSLGTKQCIVYAVNAGIKHNNDNVNLKEEFTYFKLLMSCPITSISRIFFGARSQE